MKVSSAEFVKSAFRFEDFPKEPLAEVAFAGRSNVGKSSLINCLAFKKGLARTSSVPGKTRAINFYRINRLYSFADLPGYGYAKVSKEMRMSWKWLIEGYLKRREQLRLVVLIIDPRRGLEEYELNFIEWLKKYKRQCLIVATKIDKLSMSERRKISLELAKLASALGLELIEFSAKTEEGKEVLWSTILGHLKKETASNKGFA